MRRSVISILYVLILWPYLVHSQPHVIVVSVQSSVDTSDHDIASVLTLWKSYLNSRPDSNYANPYWLQSEQRVYKPFDLAPNTWWGASFYQWLNRCRVTVLSISKHRDAFIIRTMFYLSKPGDVPDVNVLEILQTGVRLEGERYKLCNVLSINTQSWQREQLGRVKFVFPPEHKFNRVLAERMNQFVDSLGKAWELPIVPIEYYFADNINRVAKALGFDYWPAESNVKSGPRGFVDFRNRIIYSGGSDEWHPHEFVHILINPLFPNINPYFSEGYATLVGGSSGNDLMWHIRRNHDYLKDHPEIEVLTFKGVDPFVGPAYFIGGLLCKLAQEKGGLPLIRRLMSYGPEEKDLYIAIQDTFGVNKTDLNNFLRAKLAEYAQK